MPSSDPVADASSGLDSESPGPVSGFSSSPAGRASPAGPPGSPSAAAAREAVRRPSWLARQPAVYAAKLWYRGMYDRLTPRLRLRWGATAALLVLYLLRVTAGDGGWFIVSYALGIYLLNLLVAFLLPINQPDSDAPLLPTQISEDHRPFLRRLPEIKLWDRATKATLIALVCSLTSWTDIPVFWPILVLYFVVLVAISMRNVIRHMLQFGYVPFTRNKPRFGAEASATLSS